MFGNGLVRLKCLEVCTATCGGAAGIVNALRV